MEIFLGVILFIMGTFFGSFFTLAVYRIPLKKDITHEHSFCPNCNHKLGILDLFPVWSYLFLRGKCRYCGEKIRIRYFLLEVLSGSVFLTFYLILNKHGNFFDVEKILVFISFVFSYVTLVIVAGIDKEYRTIHASVLVFGVICQTIYMLYLYIITDFSMYRYIIYLILFVIMFFINQKNKSEKNYKIEILLLESYILFVFGEKAILLGGIFSVLSCGILKVIGRKKGNYQTIKQIPVGFVIGISTIADKIVETFIVNY